MLIIALQIDCGEAWLFRALSSFATAPYDILFMGFFLSKKVTLVMMHFPFRSFLKIELL
jgi:hypothetical protein